MSARGKQVRALGTAAAGSLAALVAALAASSSAASLPVVDPTVPAAHDTDPVVLKGSDFPGWAVPANQTVKLPLTDRKSVV